MAVTVGNTNSVSLASGIGGDVGAQFPSSCTSGSTLFALCWCYDPGGDGGLTETPTGCTDATNGAWTQALINGASAYISSDVTIGIRLTVYYKLNNTATTRITPTVSWTGGPSYAKKGIYVGEVLGLASGGSLDQCIGSVTYSSGSNQYRAGTFATFAQAEVGIAMLCLGDRDPGTTASSPLTVVTQVDDYAFLNTLSGVTSSSTGFTASNTFTGADSCPNYGAVAIAFKDYAATTTVGADASYYANMIGRN